MPSPAWLSVSFDCEMKLVAHLMVALCCSEENEDLLDVTFNVLDLLADDVEADSLGEWAALANGHDITDLDTESG